MASEIEIVVLSASTLAAAWAALNAGRSATATRDLVHAERTRLDREAIRANSARALVGRFRQPDGRSPTRVARVYNLGPGVATVHHVDVVLENGQQVDEEYNLKVVWSDVFPVEIPAGEYTRVDLIIDRWPGLRLDADVEDASGRRVRRVRLYEVGENPVQPLE